MDAKGFHAVVSSSLALLIGILLLTIYVLDRPFESQVGITTEHFVHSLEVFDAVDRGP